MHRFLCFAALTALSLVAQTPAPAPDLARNPASTAPVLNPALPTFFVAGDSTAARGRGATQQGWAVPFAIGCHHTGDVSDRWSWDFELEGLYTDQDADDDPPLEAVRDITVAAALLNAIVDFSIAENWAIYAGGGVGAAWLDIGTESDNLHDFNEDDGPFLAWQGKAGLRWFTTDSLSLNLGYRFLNVDDAEIDDDIGNSSFDLETQQHILEVGLRVLL